MANSNKPNRTIIEEYIIQYSPEINIEKLKNVKDELKQIGMSNASLKDIKSQLSLDKAFLQRDREHLRNVREKLKNKREEVKNEIQLIKLKREEKKGYGTSNIVSLISTGKFVGKLGLVIGILKQAYELVNKISDKATEFSNKMITAGSAFVDPNTKNIMASFGVSGKTAFGISNAMNLMGVSTSDMSTFTPGQYALFVRLMKTWSDGINSIDKDKLSYYNEMVQSYQSDMAVAKMKMQVEFQKYLVSISPQLEEFYDSSLDFMESLSTFINSPLFRIGSKTLISVFSSIIDFLSMVLDILSFGGLLNSNSASNYSSSQNTSNNYVQITTTTSNSFTGDTNSMFKLATDVTEQNNNYISNQLNKNGRA